MPEKHISPLTNGKSWYILEGVVTHHKQNLQKGGPSMSRMNYVTTNAMTLMTAPSAFVRLR